MDVNETNKAIEVGFQVASYVLTSNLIMTVCLAILGLSVDRVRLFWRRYPTPVVVSSAIALALSLGIIGYFVLIGLNPYDWTEMVRRAWRGGALFS